MQDNLRVPSDQTALHQRDLDSIFIVLSVSVLLGLDQQAFRRTDESHFVFFYLNVHQSVPAAGGQHRHFCEERAEEIQKALSSDYPECLESQREDEEVLDGWTMVDCRGPTLWNDLPLHIRQVPTLWNDLPLHIRQVPTLWNDLPLHIRQAPTVERSAPAHQTGPHCGTICPCTSQAPTLWNDLPLHIRQVPTLWNDLPLHIRQTGPHTVDDLPLHIRQVPTLWNDLPLHIRQVPTLWNDLPLHIRQVPTLWNDLPLHIRQAPTLWMICPCTSDRSHTPRFLSCPVLDLACLYSDFEFPACPLFGFVCLSDRSPGSEPCSACPFSDLFALLLDFLVLTLPVPDLIKRNITEHCLYLCRAIGF
ncbi:hypothetical protein F7725_021232 [Dissostichus mawsoni]|uniref:Uncharacterized protein n=1 Tax=Dissostichus mawsoni TaxID=36200 RepID=A0A7J5YFH6_DISMA|nr:hypothetical protein F7725_021232 [Dissostichus mawsoni]